MTFPFRTACNGDFDLTPRLPQTSLVEFWAANSGGAVEGSNGCRDCQSTQTESIVSLQVPLVTWQELFNEQLIGMIDSGNLQELVAPISMVEVK